MKYSAENWNIKLKKKWREKKHHQPVEELIPHCVISAAMSDGNSDFKYQICMHRVIERVKVTFWFLEFKILLHNIETFLSCNSFQAYFFLFFSFNGLGPLACSHSEPTSKAYYLFRYLVDISVPLWDSNRRRHWTASTPQLLWWASRFSKGVKAVFESFNEAQFCVLY
jgi:hypothetical protein